MDYLKNLRGPKILDKPQEYLESFINPFLKPPKLYDGEIKKTAVIKLRSTGDIVCSRHDPTIIIIFPGFTNSICYTDESLENILTDGTLFDQHLSTENDRQNIRATRLTGTAARFYLTSEEDNGYWEACRLSSQSASDFTIIENNQKKGVGVSKALDSNFNPRNTRSYQSGTLKELQNYIFKLNSIDNDHKFSTVSESSLFSTKWDMIFLKIHGRKGASGPSVLRFDTVSNQELVYAETSTFARIMDDSPRIENVHRFLEYSKTNLPGYMLENEKDKITPPKRKTKKHWYSTIKPFSMRSQPLLQYSGEYDEPTTDNGRSPADSIREMTTSYNGPHNGSGLERTDWDGVTTFGDDEWNPDSRNGNSDGLIVGLHQLYDHLHPFKDEYNPTVSEIDNWNIEVCKHFRKIMGKSSVEASRATFLLARFQTIREYGTVFDIHPWTGMFIPPEVDQTPFLDAYPQYPLSNGSDVTVIPTTSSSVGNYYGNHGLSGPFNWFRVMNDWVSTSATWFLGNETEFIGIDFFLGGDPTSARTNLFSIHDDVYNPA